MSYDNGYGASGGGAKPDALGQSEAFLEFQERLSRVAKVDRPVLIVGERGTGKELAIARLHYLSARWQGPLVALNCAALAPAVLESELFGHEAGSFTGAVRRREGRFEAANSGTLFLDEIGLIPIEVQEKILRAVEYRQFERVGGSEPVQVDVRIIGATNADLPQLAAAGKFKRDLLDRLSFEVLFLPALRERREDIMLLARHFAARMAAELGRPGISEFSNEAVDALELYPWPGNIRELKNVVERAVYKSEGPIIEQVDFDPFASPYAQQHRELPVAAEKRIVAVTNPAEDVSLNPEVSEFPPVGINLVERVKDYELSLIKAALAKARYHQGDAAGLLGVSYHQFRGLYRKYKQELDSAEAARS
jgi:psp operon transcriptional activator